MSNGRSGGNDYRFCDLVLKGGITSGVVYPRAIARLADVYRFKSIGGTSVGAIAAVATAAAEYRRWKQRGDMAGFAELAKLSDELQQAGRLFSLFQPVPDARRLFRVLAMGLNARNHLTRFGRVLLGMAIGYWVAAACGTAVGLGTWPLTDSVCAAVLAGVLTWLLFTGLGIVHDLSGPVVAAGYGLCSGREEQASWWMRGWRKVARKPSPQGLMTWLHGVVQRVAGLHVDDDPPLTFGALWQAGTLPEWLKDAPQRAIDLRMFTTSVSHGRPYVLPFEDEQPQLFYRRSELAKCVPDAVMKHLDCVWRRLEKKPELPDNVPSDLRPLPPPKDFPIVLAARMSLAFPLLFAAVPLWVKDDCVWPCALRQSDAKAGDGRLRRCWFSDGGIASNFPVHLFDDLLPMWPTFGIQLECVPDAAGPRDPQSLVRLPEGYDEGFEERWNAFDDKRGYAGLSGFLFAVFGTMQNWNDNTLARMPGVRDRVVRLGTFDHEGGLNLDMEREAIEALAQRGKAAAEKLIERYGPQGEDRLWGDAWDNQRWVRLGVLLTLLGKRFEAAERAIKRDIPYATSYRDLVDRANGHADRARGAARSLAGMRAQLSDEQAQAVREHLDAIANCELRKAFPAKMPPEPFYAVPQPDLRIRPSL